MEPQLGDAQPQFTSGEFNGIISGQTVTGGSSFTALLELPPPQAVEFLVKDDFPVNDSPTPPFFPTDIGLVHRASKFSIFASADNSLESNAIPSSTNSMTLGALKQEQLGADSRRNYYSPAGSDQSLKSGKRRKREKMLKESNKKSKYIVANGPSDDGGGQELPYIHVRARRGQATDSHSLAERARREKINARMRLLQEIVPGCNKISGTAVVLDEIINHVQALQCQVEFLSMSLAAVSPGIDFDLDSIFAANGSSNNTGNTGMFSPSCSEVKIDGTRQLQLWHRYEPHPFVWASEADTSSFIAPANSLLSYDSSSANSASQHSSQLKTEL